VLAPVLPETLVLTLIMLTSKAAPRRRSRPL